MYEKDREFVKARVLEVFAEWGVTPVGRGLGPGDIEYWVDVIIAAKGWEPYWPEFRMPKEFEAAGYKKGVPATPKPTESDQYVVILKRIEDKIDFLTSKLQKYF